MFRPLDSRADVVTTGFEIALQSLRNDWFVGFLHWDLTGGGVADTPFARVTGHLLDDKRVVAALIWLVNEQPGDELVQHVLQLLSETLLGNGGMRMSECSLYTAISPPTGAENDPLGRFTISRRVLTASSISYQVRFLPEELYRAQAFEEESYIDVAMIETFEDAGNLSGAPANEFATLCITAPPFAGSEMWRRFLSWFAETATGAANGHGLFCRSPNIFAVHAEYLGTAHCE